jgi:hypothetical protein
VINKLYYENVVKVHKITPRQYKNALTGKSSGGGFWFQVGDGMAWFLWGWVIGTIIGAYIVFQVVYPFLSVFFSAAFGCSPDNPILVTFITLTLVVWLIEIAIFGIDKNGDINK